MSRNLVVTCGYDRFTPRCGTCRSCRQVAALTSNLDNLAPLPVVPQHAMSGFSLYAKPHRRGETAHDRQIDALLEQLGIR